MEEYTLGLPRRAALEAGQQEEEEEEEAHPDGASSSFCPEQDGRDVRSSRGFGDDREVPAAMSPPGSSPRGDENEPPPDVQAEQQRMEGKDLEESKCGICFEKVEEQGVLDSCRHNFCFVCIRRWSRTANSCPMCKADFFTITRRPVGQPLEGPPGADQAEGEDASLRPRKRAKRGRGSSGARTRRQPQVVRVKPRKQQYRLSRREIEEIAHAADLADLADLTHPALPHRPFLFHQLDAPPLLPIVDFLFGLGDRHHHPGAHADNDDDDYTADNDDDSAFSLDDDSESAQSDGERLDEPSSSGHAMHALRTRRTERGVNRHRRHHRDHWGETEVEANERAHRGGARDRIRNLLEARARRRGFARFGGHAQWLDPSRASHESSLVDALSQHNQEHQERIDQGLGSLTDMFGDSMDAETLEAILHQVGGTVERAVDAIIAMQDPSGVSSTAPHDGAAPTPSQASSPTALSPPPSRRYPHPTSQHASSGASRLSLPPLPPRQNSPIPADTPVVIVPDEDVEFITERRVRPHRPRAPPAESPTPTRAQFTASTPVPSWSPRNEPHLPLGGRQSFSGSRRHQFLPHLSTSPSVPLPPLVADDVDTTKEQDGVEMAWRDYAEIRRETKREQKRKQSEETSTTSSSPSSTSFCTPGSPLARARRGYKRMHR